MRTVINLIILITLAGCGTARVTGTGPSWTELRCQRLMDQRDGATWGAGFASGLGGLGGLSTAFPEEDDDTSKGAARRARYGIGISAAVMGVLGTSLMVLAKLKASEFEQGCGAAPEGSIEIPPVTVIRPDDTVIDVEWTPVDGGVTP